MMLTRLILISVFLMPSIVHSQSKEEIIKKVRDRYYRINNGNVELLKIEYDNSDYYLDNSRISVIKHKTGTGRYEYYFDTKSSKYYPYFIYFESADKNSKPDLRAYYDDRSDLILLKINQDELKFNPFNHHYYYLELDAYNKLNKLLNFFELANYQDDARTIQVLNQSNEIKKSITQVDTVQNINQDSGDLIELTFKNSRGNIVKTQLTDAAEHHGETKHEYFKHGKLVLRIEESESWVGNYTGASIVITYFEDGKAFRSDTYLSHGEHPGYNNNVDGDLEYSIEKMVPRVRYFDCEME